MLGVVLNGIFVELGLCLTYLHVIDTDAVVGKGFTMNVSDGFADLEEPLVLVNSCLKLSQIVV